MSEPRIIERGPYLVVGVYCTFEGEDEGSGWSGAHAEFFRREHEIVNRVDDLVLGFIYRPHEDDASIPENTNSCFVGVEVADLDRIPDGMSVTRFSGGQYVVVECKGDVQEEAGAGVAEAIHFLKEKWLPEHGYRAEVGCFACSHEDEARPPFIEHVYVRLEKLP